METPAGTPVDTTNVGEKGSRDSILKIDTAGDLILRVGSKPAVSLLVSSKVLSVASEVFKECFRPHLEQDSAPGHEPVELPLPDDNATAMTILCQLLHHQHSTSQDQHNVSVTHCTDLTLLCDKYECMDAMRPLARTWFPPQFASICSIPELGQRLLISYMLDEASAFNEASKQLTLRYKETFLESSEELPVHNMLPFTAYIALELERNKLRNIISRDIQGTIAPIIGKEHVNQAKMTLDKTHAALMHTNDYEFGTHDAFMVSGYLRQLRKLGVWPLDLHNTKISHVIEQLTKFQTNDLTSAVGYAVFGRVGHCSACMKDTNMHVENLIGKLKNEAKGLCLKCVKGAERGAISANTAAVD